jgi:four helix bundle protein
MLRSFTNLRAWQHAHKLALAIYSVTDDFPKEEVFGLTSQLRRAAVSVGSNLAEGFGRNSVKDKEYFYTIASGSLYEIKSQLLLAQDLGYFREANFNDLAGLANKTHILVNALIKSHRRPNDG